MGRLLAFCVAGHHAGLANGVNGDNVTALTDRLDCTFGKGIPAIDLRWRTEITVPDPPPLPKFRERDSKRGGFQFAFTTSWRARAVPPSSTSYARGAAREA